MKIVHIDKDNFEKLCSLQCTRNEVCSFFDCDPKTLNAWCKKEYGKSFSGVFADKRGKGLISLRRNQLKLSESNASMAIWLGRQYLGQEDHPGRGSAQCIPSQSQGNVKLEDLYGEMEEDGE